MKKNLMTLDIISATMYLLAAILLFIGLVFLILDRYFMMKIFEYGIIINISLFCIIVFVFIEFVIRRKRGRG